MRLVTTNLTYNDVKPQIKQLVDRLFQRVPAGVGSTGFVNLTKDEFRKVVREGAHWAVEKGYGWKEDLEVTELSGRAEGADDSKISAKAVERGFSQIGTLGSGNHYLEIQAVKKENIHDEKLAKKWGIFENQIVVMFHCLPEDSRILTEYGSWIKIKDLQNKKIKIKCFDEKSHALIDTEIEKFYKVKDKEKMFKLKTRSGKEIVATEDHPFFTQDGLKFIKDIKIGEKIAVYPFDGVEHEEPSDEIVVDEHAIRRIQNSDKIVNELKSKSLLPLRLDSAYIPILSKLSGYITGDGNVRKHGRGWSTSILGDVADLEKVKEDIVKLGFRASKIYKTNAGGFITTQNGIKQKIEGKSNRLECNSSAFTILLIALGVPLGRKTSVEFEVPRWVFKVPHWIKRLYLAGYFGAELTHPMILKSDVHLERLSLATYKVENLKESGMKFLSQVKSLLQDFGINSSVFEEINGGRLTNIGRTSKLVLRISSEMINLINFWSKVDYEYCERKKIESSHALQYLQYKQNILQLNAEKLNTDMNGIKFKPYQYGVNFITISNFLEGHKFNPSTPVIWDVVEIAEETRSKEHFVYDIRVKNENHNFIANNFVVGNCGSRGFGHQLGTDYLQSFLEIMERKYKIKILDRELACAPFNSPEGQNYFSAMKCGVNMAFVNRQVILHRIREVFSEIFKQDAEKLGLHQLFDVSHNKAAVEKHKVDGQTKEVVVHRKGATGSYPAGREEIPKKYREDGSPVILGGSMMTGSYLLVGGPNAPDTFCSTAHGSGRTMSRTQATKMFKGQELFNEMLKQGIYVKSTSWSGLAEEAGPAYKDIDEVINSVHNTGISKRVVKLIPLGNVKG